MLGIKSYYNASAGDKVIVRRVSHIPYTRFVFETRKVVKTSKSYIRLDNGKLYHKKDGKKCSSSLEFVVDPSNANLREIERSAAIERVISRLASREERREKILAYGDIGGES